MNHLALKSRSTAFTLLEVIIALVIVAMIAAALSAALTVAFKARKSALASLTQIRQARLAMEIVGGDLQTTLPPTGVLAGAFFATPDSPAVNYDTLELYNTAGPGSASVTGNADVQKVILTVLPESELAVAIVDENQKDARAVGPRLESPGNFDSSDMVLVRRVTRRLLAQETPEPAYQIVARHVQSFRLRLYDGQDWLDTWDSTTLDNILPKAVEVTIELLEPVTADQISTGKQPKTYVMTRIFQLPAYASAESISAQSTNRSEGGFNQ